MRTSVLLSAILVAARADADDSLGVGAAVGAGGQGAATYGAVELSLDVEWREVRLGLGARGVWLDGEFRTRDWDHGSAALTVLRVLELHSPGRELGLAAGALSQARIAQVADGHRAALDDHRRTGIRGGAVTRTLALELEIDDVVGPSLVGGALGVALSPRWGLRAATAIDPTAPAGTRAATEVAMARTWLRERAHDELGGGVVYEPGFGASVVAFGIAERDRGSARWSARADVRAGTGTVGGAFGPLYRLERGQLWKDSEVGVGAGAAAGVASPRGWITAGVRLRPGHGVIGSISAGAPMGRWLQAGAWAAAASEHAAGAGELRIAWARRLSSALQVARMYDTDAMQPAPQWSVTAWFGATSD